jgi:hypothetical protein
MKSTKDFEVVNNPYEEARTMADTTASAKRPTADGIEQIKRQLSGLPAQPGKEATAEQQEAYYQALEALGRAIVKGWFDGDANMTARRPFGALPKNPYKTAAEEVQSDLYKKDKTFGGKRAEILQAVALSSQQIWLERESISNHAKLKGEEKANLTRLKNDDIKKELLTKYLSLPDEKRTLTAFKRMVTIAKKRKVSKAEVEKEKATKKTPEVKVAKVKPVVGKKEIDALIKQAETAEKELTKAKSDFDKAMDKVKQAQGKLKEELLVTKRLMEREQ